MRPGAFLKILFAAAAAVSLGIASPLISIRASLVIKVNDKDEASKALIDWVESRQGYFTNYSGTAVTFKLPNQSVDSFLVRCDSLGLVADKNYETQDLTLDIGRKEASLKAKQKLLEDYYDILHQARLGKVMEVERAIVNLIAEIERDMGKLKVMRHKTEMADLTASFQFIDRSPPVPEGDSPFTWLNHLDLIQLREDFEGTQR
ncbi:DUF4349 domain-containing protein [Fibrobacterota bacterium]